MKKSIVLSLVCFMFISLTIHAQKDYYTYLTDKRFKGAEDLFGYTFVPGLMEIAEPGQTKAGEQVKISAGSYKFGVTRGNLFVKGEDINGIHNINQINTTEYGYQLMLMNARDPKQQGHLKIIMLKNFVDALVFKANNDAAEMIFLLPEIDKGLNETEKNYFTDKSEIEIELEEDIWGQELKPFFKTVMPKRTFQRIRKGDDMKISFIETEKIIEKGKKNKNEVVLAVNDNPVPSFVEPTPEPEIIEEEEANEGFPSYFKVKKKEAVKEKIMEEVVEEDLEEELEEVIETAESDEDLFAKPEKLEEVKENRKGKKNKNKEKKNKEKKNKEKKTKIETAYEVVISDFVFNDDGTKEPIETILKVKDWKMRTDESARNPNEVYQLELDTNKGPMYIYLSGSRRVTKVEFGPYHYIMRGL